MEKYETIIETKMGNQHNKQYVWVCLKMWIYTQHGHEMIGHMIDMMILTNPDSNYSFKFYSILEWTDRLRTQEIQQIMDMFSPKTVTW